MNCILIFNYFLHTDKIMKTDYILFLEKVFLYIIHIHNRPVNRESNNALNGGSLEMVLFSSLISTKHNPTFGPSISPRIWRPF